LRYQTYPQLGHVGRSVPWSSADAIGVAQRGQYEGVKTMNPAV
jgi:hypothetical protein